MLSDMLSDMTTSTTTHGQNFPVPVRGIFLNSAVFMFNEVQMASRDLDAIIPKSNADTDTDDEYDVVDDTDDETDDEEPVKICKKKLKGPKGSKVSAKAKVHGKRTKLPID